jgi:hypothetical protein
MIGGRDIVIPILPGSEPLDLAVRAVSRLWPAVVLEDAETGENLGHYWDMKFAGRREVLAFRDKESATRWDQLGADPSLDGTLIHFLLSDRELTLVVDASPSAEIVRFVEALRCQLGQDIFAVTAVTKEAA